MTRLLSFGLISGIIIMIIMGTAGYAQVAGSGARFAASPTPNRAPLGVVFSYPHTVDNSSWMMEVDFGDGTSGKLQSPCADGRSGAANYNPAGLWTGTHTYPSAGTYKAILTRGGLPLCFGCLPPVIGTITVTVPASAP
jgi:hypothetical protein